MRGWTLAALSAGLFLSGCGEGAAPDETGPDPTTSKNEGDGSGSSPVSDASTGAEDDVAGADENEAVADPDALPEVRYYLLSAA